jgi:nicotianamine synthase
MTKKVVYGRLTQFPYFSNYVDLTRMELAAIHAVNASPIKKIAFLGSGPLPLTSLRLCHTLSNNITVLNIDNNSLAISQSSNLCARLGRRGRGMEVKCSDAGSELCDLKDFDVVYLAALVGSSQEEKEGLLVGVVGRMREGAVLVVRSAWGLRRLLYAVCEKGERGKGGRC